MDKTKSDPIGQIGYKHKQQADARAFEGPSESEITKLETSPRKHITQEEEACALLNYPHDPTGIPRILHGPWSMHVEIDGIPKCPSKRYE